jgi:hypothetical protein
MTILIDNFSIAVDDWMLVSDLNYFSVDVVDSTYGISSAHSYFLRDGVQVVTTFSGITGGYRMFYTPISVVSSGTFTITAHVQNNNSDIAEQTFDLLYGYNTLFDEVVDWGANKQVDVLIRAKNEVICPNEVGEGFYFITAELSSVNLGASIRAVESINLGAVIYPQSTTFFYGKTYTITISGVKDYSGNIMDPYTFTFTIEDPTS